MLFGGFLGLPGLAGGAVSGWAGLVVMLVLVMWQRVPGPGAGGRGQVSAIMVWFMIVECWPRVCAGRGRISFRDLGLVHDRGKLAAPGHGRAAGPRSGHRASRSPADTR